MDPNSPNLQLSKMPHLPFDDCNTSRKKRAATLACNAFYQSTRAASSTRNLPLTIALHATVQRHAMCE